MHMKTILVIFLLLPLSLFAKFVRMIQIGEPPHSAFIDDEIVYIVTTTVRRYIETRFDPEISQFVDARSKRILKFADDERITKLERLSGIGTGGTIVGFTNLDITQGTTVFAYPFDAEIGKKEMCADLLLQAVDGDRIQYRSGETNHSFVASFSPKDNAIHWLNPVTFEVCESLPLPDNDMPFYYSRMQQTNSTVSIVGGRLQKDIGIISFRDHDIDEVYRIVESAGPEHPVDENNLLYRKPTWQSTSDRPSVLTPRKFYVVLKDGRKAFGMFQPQIEKNPVIFSPITYAPLAVAKDDIATFEVIDDSAFPTAECYFNNEVVELYKRFVNLPESEDAPSKIQSIGKFFLTILIACFGWLMPIVLMPISDSLSKWLAIHPVVHRITIGLSIIVAIIFFAFN